MLAYVAVVAAVNLVIPKAGVKVGDIPVTLGNILFLGLLTIGAIAVLARNRVPHTGLNGLVGLLIAYMAVRTIVSAVLGTFDFGFAFSLVFAPLMFFAVVASARRPGEIEMLARIYVIGFAALATYGVAQYVLGVNAVALPGITVNLTDFQSGPEWYLRKDNRVEGSSKLFATYQNGNIFGVNLILIFGVAHEAMKGRWRLVGFTAFLVLGMLTLSRSVWLGLAAYILFRFVLTRAASPAGAAARVMLGAGLLFAIPVLFGFFPQLTTRLFQTPDVDSLVNAAGRTPRLVALIESSASNPIAVLVGPDGVAAYSGGAYEITYGAVYMVGGVIALALFLAVVLRTWRTLHKSPSAVARGAGYGVAAYAVASTVEGAFWLPPTALVFWMTMGVGYAAHRAAVGTMEEADEHGLRRRSPRLSRSRRVRAQRVTTVHRRPVRVRRA
ncbi:O-antigen ligase family protein [Demequina iriomotensis]|uniref:O-antigen ligase family protein n=1 Tax=Demequina iriomotensis TaxID=1536641 RepID=UPI000783CE25|nr:hypothetical protein [Demequina iriomotensis]